VTPEQEEGVSRALAEVARGQALPTGDAGAPDPPMPPDVVARLDGVLEELAAPRRGAGGTDELAARRRRSPHVLVAAAAACVIALAGAAVVTRGFGTAPGGSGTESTTAGRSLPGSQEDREPGASGGAVTPRGEGVPAPPVEPRALRPGASAGAAADGPELHRATLAGDVQGVLDGRRQRTGTPTATTCRTPTVRRGEEVLAVRLDGRRATLLLGAPRDGRRSAAVLSCTRPGTPLARTSVRVR